MSCGVFVFASLLKQGRSTPVKNGAAPQKNRFGTGGFAPGADAY